MNKQQLFLFGITAILLVNPVMAQTENYNSNNLDTVLLTTDPVPVQSGEDAEITFKLVKRGDTAAENVQVNIQDSFPFQLKPDEKRTYNLGTVNPGEEYYITTEVLVAEDSPDGENNLRVQVGREGNDISVTKELPISVQSSNVDLNLANLQTTPSTLMPDTDDNQMTVEAVNNGEKTAENVVIDLNFPESFQERSSFASRQVLGNLEPGQVKAATFNFDISENASTGDISVPGTISYSSGNDTGKVEKQVSFTTFLNGKPQYEVVNMSSNLRTGSSGTLRMQVKNTGSESSSSTRIRLLDNSDLPFTFDSSSQYIGTLEPGQTGTAVFDVTTESDATAKEYLLDFEIRGVKGTEVFVDDKTLRVNATSSGSSNGPSNATIAGIVALLVVGGAIVFLFRERLGL